MKELDYIVYKEGKYYVSQCINVNVSSFGDTPDEALTNLKEAVELYLEDEEIEFPVIENITIGREPINA
jgi:predicted RNase H-like HicB family nuclease